VHDARSLEIFTISSWAFLFLGLPLLFAYGAATKAGAPFFALVPFVLLLFAVTAHEIGLAVIVTLVRAFPGLDMKRLVLLALAALVPVGIFLARAFRVQEIGPDDDVSELLVHALEGLGRTQYPMLPGYWAAECLRASTQGEAARAAFFLWALAVTALFFGMLAREASCRWLVPAQQILRGRGLANPVGRRTRSLSGSPSAGPLRALSAKDAVLFFREAGQWSQALLVAVLAAVYVMNLRNLPELARFDLWGRVAAALNAGVVLLLVSTLTTRFAFPLVSLEGRRAWIVFLAPLRRGSIVRQKALVALGLTLPFALLAAGFSTHVLGVGREMQAVTLLAAACGAFALSGLSVGLGALFPSFKDDNPARIVSGFGGTVNFLAGLSYVATMAFLVGAPKVALALSRIDAATEQSLSRAALAVAVLVSLLAGLVPVVLGMRRLEAMEL
jgi:ABC-2 type transport system permease protein